MVGDRENTRYGNGRLSGQNIQTCLFTEIYPLRLAPLFCLFCASS
jgi:hypothetical protein